MPWQVLIHLELGVVETVYAGTMPAAEMKAAVAESNRAALEHGFTRLLSDCTAHEGGYGISDLYHLAASVQTDPFASRLKEAVLAPGSGPACESARFYETTCLNRGLTVRLFTDRQAALDWLK